MQNQDNHMDELFRKAAENYPLKTGEDNWDDIAAAFARNNSLADVAVNRTTAGNIAKRILPVLLFLIISGGSVIYFMGSKSKNTLHVNPSSKQENVKAYGEEENISTTANKTARTISSNNNIYQPTKIKSNNPVLKEIERKGPVHIEQPVFNNMNIILVIPLNSGHDSETGAVLNKTAEFNNTKPHITMEEYNLQPLTAVNPDENKTNKALVPEIKNKLKKQKGLYAGFVMGAGFSEVKSQGLTKPGLEGGIMGGYQFNGKLSIETGLLFSKKYYFSDGVYFKMNNISAPMPQGMQVLSLTGSSSLFEIPVKVKYNIRVNKKSNFFTTAGLTSYIMTKEKNNYLALINGNKQNISTTYNKSNKYLAAAIDISAGYEIKINHNKTLRIEPYVQIPLKGIGVGTMPVMSTGLHIGCALFKK